MWARTRITRFEDLVGDKLRFLWVKPDLNGQNGVKHLEVIEDFAKGLEALEDEHFSKEGLKDYLRDFPVKNNIPFPDFMKTLRSLLSGLKVR